jgi:hypothetical protein
MDKQCKTFTASGDIMPLYQVTANEQFFLNTMRLLSEGGLWVWKDKMIPFTLIDGSLRADAPAIDLVGKIVSEPFLKKYFRIS